MTVSDTGVKRSSASWTEPTSFTATFLPNVRPPVNGGDSQLLKTPFMLTAFVKKITEDFLYTHLLFLHSSSEAQSDILDNSVLPWLSQHFVF